MTMTTMNLSDSLLPQLSSGQIRLMSDELAARAQAVYDAWDQDADGFDVELGAGGICQDIASAMIDALAENGFDVAVTSTTMGDNHVYVVAALSDGVWAVDIPPSVYEHGGGFVWTKKQGVTLTGQDVTLLKIHDTVVSGEDLVDMFAE